MAVSYTHLDVYKRQIKDPNDKQRAIRDLEYLLLSPAEKEKLREDRTARRQPGGPPRF